MADFNTTAAEIGALVTEKNAAYGDSFAKCGRFLQLLYPNGIEPPQYADALAMVRIFDKQMRIATRIDAFGESPYRDIAGYGILGAANDAGREPAPLIKDTTFESLCHTCQRNKGCIGDYPRTKDGGCEGYVMAEEESKQYICALCRHGHCEKYMMLNAKMNEQCMFFAAKDTQPDLPCGDFSAKDAPTAAERPAPHTDPAVSALDFSLPPITLKCTAEEAAGKFWSEREEWKAAKKGSIHELVERWDCLQALYTFAERGGDVEWYQDHVRVVMEDLARYQADGGEVMRAKRQMLRKNAKRSYYAPEVNEAILSTCGHRYTPVLGG